jgi:hypothetical protein
MVIIHSHILFVGVYQLVSNIQRKRTHNNTRNVLIDEKLLGKGYSNKGLCSSLYFKRITEYKKGKKQKLNK